MCWGRCPCWAVGLGRALGRQLGTSCKMLPVLMAMAEPRVSMFGNSLDARGAGLCPGCSSELQGTQLALGDDLEQFSQGVLGDPTGTAYTRADFQMGNRVGLGGLRESDWFGKQLGCLQELCWRWSPWELYGTASSISRTCHVAQEQSILPWISFRGGWRNALGVCS